MERTFTFEVSEGNRSLGGLREALRVWLAEVGVEPAAAEEIVLSCWEAALNALEHPSEAGAPVEISAERPNGHVIASVTDSGRWQRVRRRRGSYGLGMTLIAALMDRVVVVRTRRGTRVLMCRCLDDLPRRRVGGGRVHPTHRTVTSDWRPHAIRARARQHR